MSPEELKAAVLELQSMSPEKLEASVLELHRAVGRAVANNNGLATACIVAMRRLAERGDREGVELVMAVLDEWTTGNESGVAG